jgi:hypothetical protein
MDREPGSQGARSPRPGWVRCPSFITHPILTRSEAITQPAPASPIPGRLVRPSRPAQRRTEKGQLHVTKNQTW